MENETPETTEESFGKVVAKEFAQSLAISAGVWGGLFVAAFAVGQIQEAKKRRVAKKNPETTEK